ncbi:S8 family serine peptidase [Spirosoma sp. BT702]|uniref:S8 family serine peptidase n=1 Tax=Spirosoma profusum TaxID=2771354 RepID=A0A927AS82_9BACT|nr:S8 family serine peptidase [Spirosoma profusum]MBD2700860.1 S8 family serine peptidase [Spirosoma profusum]
MKLLFYLIIPLIICLHVNAQMPTAKKPGSKLSGGLQEISDTYQRNNRIDTTLLKSQQFQMDKTGQKIVVDAVAETDGETLEKALRKAGFAIIARYGRVVTCQIEISRLPELETLADCRFANPAERPQTNTGPVNTQGDASQRSDLIRQQYGLTGQGVKVGVMSDSYNALLGAPASVTAGELPGVGNPNGFTTAVTVVQDYTLAGATDEGRAMLEIVHDIAPAAQLYYRTASVSQADFAAGIEQLANVGCRVIIDDIKWLAEPFFQDGLIAQSVDKVNSLSGVSYFSAAGNYADVSYENNYVASTFKPLTYTAATAHNFGTAANPVYFFPIQLAAGRRLLLSFQWDDPFFSVTGGSGATGDLDIYLFKQIPTTFPVNPTSSTLIAQLNEQENLGRDPYEFLNYTNNTGTTQTYYILLTKYSGTAPNRLKFVDIRNNPFPPSALTIAGVGASTCYGHYNSAGAIVTGAAPFYNTPAYGVSPPQIESFSSKGGTPILFSTTGVRLTTPIIRQKPDVTGPDGGNNSFFNIDSPNDADTFPNFFGTSASAPHIGAIAALMLQAKPALTPTNIKTALIASCVDMDDPTTAGFDAGFDFRTGYGLVQGDVAIKSILPPGAPCASVASGNWNSLATWSCGFLPLAITPVTIGAGHIVTIDGVTAKAQLVKYSGSGKVRTLNSGKLSFLP